MKPGDRDDEVDVESAAPVTPKQFGQMIPIHFRLDPEIAAALCDLAGERGVSVGDLLREGARKVLAGETPAVSVDLDAVRRRSNAYMTLADQMKTTHSFGLGLLAALSAADVPDLLTEVQALRAEVAALELAAHHWLDQRDQLINERDALRAAMRAAMQTAMAEAARLDKATQEETQ
jgi:hypothetical protein